MADNVVIKDGQGEERTLATHESGGVHTPVNRISGPLLEAAETIADAVHAEDAAHADGDAGVQVLAVRRDADTSLVGATGDYAPLQVDANGRLKVAVLAGTQDDALTDAELRASAVPVSLATLPALPAGSNVIGDVGLTGRTSGGLTLHRTISAATTNATSVKASAGQVFWVYATNTNASPRYLKLYNKASAPTVGTDTPVLTLLIPGNTVGAGFHLQSPLGLAFGTGIAFALTTGVADADATGVGANEIVVNLGFK